MESVIENLFSATQNFFIIIIIFDKIRIIQDDFLIDAVVKI